MLTRSTTGRILVALVVSAATATLIAASPHYKKGGQPACSIDTSTGTASCSQGLVAGLGNDDVRVTLSVLATDGQICHNPGNPDNYVLGQNPATASGSSTLNIGANQIKNGTLTIPPISATAVLAASSAAAAGCPNPNWTVTLAGNPTYSGVYSFQQPPGVTIEKLSFTF
jgi:hypothetical protein